MIIGAILSTRDNSATPSGVYNGSSMLHFYTMSDAINWAESQSNDFRVGIHPAFSLCTVINTDTGERRWWYAGTEYTG